MSKNIKLNMSRRIRRTPYTNRVEEHGVSDFTVVNHMLLPKGFKNSVEEDYWHLSKNVQMWDVSCQRQVQISGPTYLNLSLTRNVPHLNIFTKMPIVFFY